MNKTASIRLIFLILIGFICCLSAEGAVIKLLSGKTITGNILKEDETHVTVSITEEGASITVPVRKSLIHSITDDNGKTRIINEKTSTNTQKPKVKATPKREKPPVKTESNDWPWWRGPDRDGISKEKGLKLRWSPDNPPKTLWTKNINKGFSTVAVANGRAYTMGNDGSQDTVWCFDAATGKEIWKDSYACGSGQYPGPRSTPTVDGNTVYTFSRKGDLHAYNASNGQVLWKKNPVNELKAQRPGWDYASSPLVLGNLIVVNVGTAGTALNKQNGSIIWKTGNGKAGYATPVPVMLGGKQVLLIFSGFALHMVDAASGSKMWEYGWRTQYDVNAADPIFHNNSVFISSNYNRGCTLLRVTPGGTQKVYENKAMRNHFNSCVLYNGYLYGVDNSSLKCIEFATGNEKWNSRVSAKGSLIIADNKLVILSERGKLVIAEADPSSYKEICSHDILSGRCWSHPTISNGRLYARNEAGTLICIAVK